MDIKTSFFDVLSEVKKDLEDVFAGLGKFCPEFDVKVGEVNFDLAW